MASFESPLDAYAHEIRELLSQGIGPTGIATILESDYAVATTEASVRRCIKRHNMDSWQEENDDDRYWENTKWGMGYAKLVEPSTTESTEVVVFGSDFHYPYHDPVLVDDFIELVRAVRPHRVVINGDVNDYFQLSHFNISKQRLDDLQWEIDGGNELRRRIRDAAPDAVIDENQGNHDERIITYVLQNARALSSLRALDPANLFMYNQYEIIHHPSGAGFLLRPEFLVKHGTIVRSEAGATAKAELLQAGVSGISGHVHRLTTYRKAGYVQRQWTEMGCLCRMDADYIKSGVPNWSSGCAIGEFSTKTSNFCISEIPSWEGHLKMNFISVGQYANIS